MEFDHAVIECVSEAFLRVAQIVDYKRAAIEMSESQETDRLKLMSALHHSHRLNMSLQCTVTSLHLYAKRDVLICSIHRHCV